LSVDSLLPIHENGLETDGSHPGWYTPHLNSPEPLTPYLVPTDILKLKAERGGH
jgi:hypothetical protein